MINFYNIKNLTYELKRMYVVNCDQICFRSIVSLYLAYKLSLCFLIISFFLQFYNIISLYLIPKL